MPTSIENIRDDALIRLGLSVGLRVSEVVGLRTSEIDFDRGLIKIWDEKKHKKGTNHRSERVGSRGRRTCKNSQHDYPETEARLNLGFWVLALEFVEGAR